MATAVHTRGARLRVADAMIACPETHGADATVGELRAFFEDDHVHMALLVEDGRLAGVVERSDLPPVLGDDTPATSVAALAGRTTHADATLVDVFGALQRNGRRRLAVIDDGSVLVGLLCLKRSGLGFCSDDDVLRRRLQPDRARP
jgi:CBS domain-containing protein